MKYFKYLKLISILFIISCKGKEQDVKTFSIGKNDTLFVSYDCGIIISASDKKIFEEKKKFKNKDDFYVEADDANFYIANARNFLQNKNIRLVNINKPTVINFNNQYYINSDSLDIWKMLLYKKNNKPKPIYPVDVEKEYDYFGKKQNIENDFYVLDSVKLKLQNSSYKINILEKTENKNKENAQHNSNPIIIYKNDKKLIENSVLINLYNENCPADGYFGIDTKKNYFTLKEIFCDNNQFITAYITFKISDKIYLYKYGEEYSSRENPDKVIPNKIWTAKDFGILTFENTNENYLVKLRQQPPKK